MVGINGNMGINSRKKIFMGFEVDLMAVFTESGMTELIFWQTHAAECCWIHESMFFFFEELVELDSLIKGVVWIVGDFEFTPLTFFRFVYDPPMVIFCF